MNSSRFSVYIARKSARAESVSNGTAAWSIRFDACRSHAAGTRCRPHGRHRLMARMGIARRNAGTASRNAAAGTDACRRGDSPSFASALSVLWALHRVYLRHSANSVDLLDIVCRSHFATNCSVAFFKLQHLFDASGTSRAIRCALATQRTSVSASIACRRGQSNSGPGSVLRPGAMSEWPATPLSG
jgi:hypothetical protein